MNHERHRKVKASHLARDAYLYVRQATRGHVGQHAKALAPQYSLQQGAMALGWPAERVIVIDSDTGHSGVSTVDRPGFQELVHQIQGGCVGIIIALDASRLARNVMDWCRLLDGCAMSETLLLFRDKLYDPGDPYDRVLLGSDQRLPVRKTIEWTPQQKEAVV